MDVKDRVGVGGHVLLGDTRSSPAPSVVAYGGTREDSGYSRGDLGRRHTGDGGGKWKRRMGEHTQHSGMSFQDVWIGNQVKLRQAYIQVCSYLS